MVRQAVTAPDNADARAARFEAGQAHVEPGVIGIPSAAPDDDHIGAGAFQMGGGTGALTGDPLAAAVGHGDGAVERHRQFQRDVRPVQFEARQEAGQLRFSLGSAHARCHRDAGGPKLRRAIAIGAWIGIVRGDHHPRHAGGNQAVGTAGPARANMGAGFQRHIGCGTLRCVASMRQRDCFGMRTAAGLRPAAPSHAAIFRDHTAD